MGKLFLIGGGPAVRVLGNSLMERFIAEAGGADTRFTIVTAGSEEPELVNACYWDLFTDLGVSQIFSPKIMSREDADVRSTADQIAESTAIFIAGGAQVKLIERLAGTATERAVREVFARGGLLGGTSAGASVFGDPLILDGGTSNKHMRRNMIKVGAGFGLLGNTTIDTHCSSRGRIPRIISLLIARPSLQAIGIDEDTALFIDESGTAEMLGQNAVYVLDGSSSSSTHRDADIETPHLCASGITLHCLTRGDRYDLAARQPVDASLLVSQDLVCRDGFFLRNA